MTEKTDKTKGKSMWGWGVGAVYTVFALGTLGVVAFTMTQRIDLVSEDYYQKELKYEQQIDRTRNTTDLQNQLTCETVDNGQAIKLQFPAGMREVKGSVLLYRPSISGMDRELEIKVDAAGTQVIPVARLKPGYWKAKVTWSSEGREYYNEFPFKV